jgi:AcrR family transcriptional regulator
MTSAARAVRRKQLPGRARPLIRRREPERKRERLLEAARSLFAERGYDATTTAQLAREAGVAEGTVFHHFPSKRALLEAVAGEYGRGLAARMFAGVDATASAPAAEAMLRRAFAYVREQGALSRLLALTPDPTGWKAARAASRREIVSALASAFSAWHGRESLREFDPQITAELLYALVEAALTECFVYGDGSREEEYLRETVACVEGALLPRSPTTHARSSP